MKNVEELKRLFAGFDDMIRSFLKGCQKGSTITINFTPKDDVEAEVKVGWQNEEIGVLCQSMLASAVAMLVIGVIHSAGKDCHNNVYKATVEDDDKVLIINTLTDDVVNGL